MADRATWGPFRSPPPAPRVLQRWEPVPPALGHGVVVEALSDGSVRLRSGDDPFEYSELDPAEVVATIHAISDALELVTRPKKT